MKESKSGLSIKGLAFQLLLLGLGILLLYLVFRGIKWEELKNAFAFANYSWLPLILGVIFFSHIIRAWRWFLLLEGLEKGRFGFWMVYHAMMTGYLVSYALPRLGEVSRCLSLKKKTGYSFQEMLGTVITERVIDFLCLVLSFLISFVVEWSHFVELYNTHLKEGVNELLKSKSWLLGLGVVLVIVFFVFYYFLKTSKKNTERFSSLIGFFEKVLNGVFSIRKIKQPLLFLTLTISIWVSYFLITWLYFFCFQESSHLSWTAGMAVQSMGSFGRSVPVQGMGMGAYHYLVSSALMSYQVPMVVAGAIAVLIHGVMTVYHFIFGLISYFWFNVK